jgi:hypothetical protein
MEKSYTTKCPKLGSKQWSCSKEECVCHLKEIFNMVDKDSTGTPYICPKMYGQQKKDSV